MKFYEFRDAPLKRQKYCAEGDNDQECHLTEAAIMVAFALYLFDQGASEVRMHPDGEHGKRFDIKKCLEHHGFTFIKPKGKTNYGGVYQRKNQTIVVFPKSGLGDVVGKIGDQMIFAECKGGIVNSRHPGVRSKLQSRLCEAVGLIMARPLNDERHIAVVPATQIAETLAFKMLPRIQAAGIEIALIDKNGRVRFVGHK